MKMVLLFQLSLFVGSGLSFPESLFKQVPIDVLPWPNQTVHYFLDTNFTKEERDKITQGVRIIQENTCINFIEGETDKFAIKGIFVIVSWDGRILLRNDRANYLKADFLNLTPYDYGSYMHYGRFPVGENRSVNDDVPAMVPTDKRYKKTIGSLRGSFYDFHTVNEFYKCNAKCPSHSSAKCFNGGVPHPRHCAICLCPPGYGGDFCDQRPGTCGKTLLAVPENYRRTTFALGEENNKREFASATCNHWIEAPPGHRVEIILIGVQQYGHGSRTRYEEASCKLSGFEFKLNEDPRLGGAVFCDPEDEGASLVSDLNPAPFMVYNYEGKQEYDVLYKAIPIEDSLKGQ